MSKSWLPSALGFALITAAAAAIGTIATRKSVDSWWYKRRLKKPSFQPPRQVFGPVWTGLYATIASSGARVWRAEPGPERTRALALWGAQMALNTGWSVIFFGARRPKVALVEIVALLGSIALYRRAAAKVDRRAAHLVTPYLAWTGFATALNAAIVRANPRLA